MIPKKFYYVMLFWSFIAMLYHHYTNNSTQFISYIVIFIGSLICIEIKSNKK